VSKGRTNELYSHGSECQPPHEGGAETSTQRGGTISARPFKQCCRKRRHERRYPPDRDDQPGRYRHQAEKILEDHRLPPRCGSLPAVEEAGAGQHQEKAESQDKERHGCIAPDCPGIGWLHGIALRLMRFDIV
jgi:hypothetical protein